MGEATDANTTGVSNQLKAARGTAYHTGEATDANTPGVSRQLVAARGTAQHTWEASHDSM